LVISSSRESLGFLGWDGGVSVNKSGENSSHGLDTKGKWGNIEQKNILNITSQNSSLNGGSNSDSLVWVDSFVWLFSEEIFDTVL